MPNYKHYMNHGFAGCRLLAESYDPYRDRPVKLYLMPSIPDAVGVTDGTDSWIAPMVADIFRVNIVDIVRRIESGEDVPVVRSSLQKRARVTLAADDQPIQRRERHRVEEAHPVARSRRVVLA